MLLCYFYLLLYSFSLFLVFVCSHQFIFLYIYMRFISVIDFSILWMRLFFLFYLFIYLFIYFFIHTVRSVASVTALIKAREKKLLPYYHQAFYLLIYVWYYYHYCYSNYFFLHIKNWKLKLEYTQPLKLA
jgi:hypothetical protein